MKKRFLSILLAMVMAFSILPTASLAAGSVEEALGEIDIYNGGQELSYLMINGRVRTQSAHGDTQICAGKNRRVIDSVSHKGQFTLG